MENCDTLLWCWAQFMSSIFLRQTEELVWFMMSFVYVYWKMFCFRETFHPSQKHTSGKILCLDLWMPGMWQVSDTAVICSQMPGCRQHIVCWLPSTLGYSSLTLDDTLSLARGFRKIKVRKA